MRTMGISELLPCCKCPVCASSFPCTLELAAHMVSLCKHSLKLRAGIAPQTMSQKKQSRIEIPLLYVMNTQGNPSWPSMPLTPLISVSVIQTDQY